eukprot:CAMPEP_0118656808 /NCGR_PEP_ID=MMETSP0785-20121206/13679_1 /TAXON_ID=91992 /ORGANISM="Bolidomonas pacifica, Strain CCMP 1866" /LENGTH=489 /DNA_ID=CAMNT_0006549677 /DNA_START=41 /DNA_END=1506 /DNA_ORIENTATION=-
MAHFEEKTDEPPTPDVPIPASPTTEPTTDDAQQSPADSMPPRPHWLPDDCNVLADGEYDAIVLGTGLKECIMSGLLSTQGLKVLHLDRYNYYGADCASLNLTNLYSKFQAGDPPTYLGSNRDYNVDLIPKFIMACGNLTKMLLHTKVTRYLEFKSIDGSFVLNGSKVLKVPATPKEALSSSLMGMFEKRRFRSFLIYINEYNQKDPSTFKDKDLTRMTMRELYVSFGLCDATHEFISHAMCLELDNLHLDAPALPTVLKLQTYCTSLETYGKSPYIYPMYGLGGLPEGFSRLCAIHGGTFMLNADVKSVLFDDDGAAWGVKVDVEDMMTGKKELQAAKATMIIGDPSYFPKEKVRTTGQVVRSICFLNHPIPNTNNAESCQIIIPGPQVNRKNDVFVCCLGSQQNVVAKGIYVAIVSTKVETQDPARELVPGLRLLGQILQRFDSVSDCYEPLQDGLTDRCFISSSFDGTSHFESDCDDLLSLYKRVTG